MAKIKPVINREWFDESASASYEIEVRPYTLKELRLLYGLKHRAMKKMLSPFLEEIGRHPGRYYSPHQVSIILAHIGPPYKIVGNE